VVYCTFSVRTICAVKHSYCFLYFLKLERICDIRLPTSVLFAVGFSHVICEDTHW